MNANEKKKQGGRLDDATAAALAATTAHAVSHEQGRSEKSRFRAFLSSPRSKLQRQPKLTNGLNLPDVAELDSNGNRPQARWSNGQVPALERPSLSSNFEPLVKSDVENVGANAIPGTHLLRPKPSSQPEGAGSTPRGSEQTQHDQHYRPPVPPKIEHHDSHGRHELPGSQPASPMEPRSPSAAERELGLIQKRIREAVDGRRIDIDAVIREDGVDAALGSLIAMYQPAVTAEHDLEIVEQQIRAAAVGNVRGADIDIAIRNRGAEGALNLLIKHYRNALDAEETLKHVKSMIKKSVRGIPRKGHRPGSPFKEEEIQDTLQVLIDDYDKKAYLDQNLARIEEQIRTARHRLPWNELDAAFKAGGVEGALRLLLASYKPCLEAERELYLVDAELGKAAQCILPPNELDAAVKRRATHDAVDFLFKTQKSQIDSLQTSLTTAATRISALEREKNRLSTHIDELRNAQTRLELKQKADLKAQRDLAAEEVYRTEQCHKAELEGRDANFESEFRQWEEVLVAAKGKHKDREARLEGEIQELKDDIKKLKNDFSAKTDEMRKEFKAKEKESHQREIARIEQYRLDNEALKGELVKREHFKGLSDPEIYTNFKKLAGEVDSFSRLPWEKRKEAYWPLSDSSLRRSDNPRRLKQYIVQSSIWFILHKMIFRSPFEIFGDEGQRMHHDWTETFGEDRRSDFPHWPEATEESEKWRYEQVKECLSAVKKPVNDSDTKKKWKKSHDESLSATANEIYKAVEAVSQVTANDLQIVQDFVKLAAKFWLEVSSQRCRVLVVFPPHIPNSLVRNQKKVAAVLELVVQPELRRIGNAQGQRLDMEHVIKGCEGDHTKFPAR